MTGVAIAYNPCYKCTNKIMCEMCELKLHRDGVAIQKWIPVSERLPNVFEGVLAYCPKHRNTYLLYINARGEWHFFDKTVAGALLDEAVTHWMPLPEPPKEE